MMLPFAPAWLPADRRCARPWVRGDVKSIKFEGCVIVYI